MDTIEKIKNIPIRSVLDRLNVKQSGSNYHCISPTHQDDTASMSVKDNENYFHCFGCNIGGSVIDLYMNLYGISFIEASRRLANDYDIPFDKTSHSKHSKKTPDQISSVKSHIEKSYKFLCEYDQYTFDERAGISGSDSSALQCVQISKTEYWIGWDDSLALQCVRTDRLERNKIIFRELYNYCNRSGICDDVYSYLVDKRKLSEDVIRTAKIFSFSNYQDINNYLKSVFDIEDLRGSGLYKDNLNLNTVDLIFRDSHRLLIPYLEDGEIIYLRSRYFDSKSNANTSGLKYFGLKNDDLNLNTVKRFYNTDILSGLKIYDELFICEGELDSLSLLTIGLNAVAIPGVNGFSESELDSLKDYNITLCFDNDPAGKKASENLIQLFDNIGKTVNIIELPDGIKDVSDFIIEKYSIKNKTDSPELTVSL